MFKRILFRLRAFDDAVCDAVVRAFDLRLSGTVLCALALLSVLAGGICAAVLGAADWAGSALCAAILLLWCVLLLAGTRLKLVDAFAPLLLLLLLFAARMSALPVVSADCRDYLLVWADVMQDLSFEEVMARRVGDYTVLYQYFVFLLARLPLDRVLMYKALSFLSEGLLAWGAATLACAASGRDKDSLLYRGVFLAVLALPTVFLNAAVWSQCDAVYAALLLAGLALCLREHPVCASVCFALSLCVKLQAIFVLPVIAVLLLLRKTSLRHVLLMGAAFILAALPAMLGGKGLKDVLGVYLYQMGEYDELALGAPSVFALLTPNDVLSADVLSRAGILFAFAACGAILYLGAKAALRAKEMDGEAELAALAVDVSFALAVCVPFLLPYMHERYFFAADVLSVVFAAVHPKRAYVPLIVIGSSLNGYLAYLMGAQVLPWSVVVPAMLVVCLIAVKAVRDRARE